MQGLSLEHFSLRTPGSGHLIAKVGTVIELLSDKPPERALTNHQPLPTFIFAVFQVENCGHALK